jgi:hypothetical protein
MNDLPPVLNYHRPPARPAQLPLGLRWILGVTAAALALLAFVLLVSGLIFAIADGEWHDLLPGVFLTAVAYLLWRPVAPPRRRW